MLHLNSALTSPVRTGLWPDGMPHRIFSALIYLFYKIFRILVNIFCGAHSFTLPFSCPPQLIFGFQPSSPVQRYVRGGYRASSPACRRTRFSGGGPPLVQISDILKNSSRVLTCITLSGKFCVSDGLGIFSTTTWHRYSRSASEQRSTGSAKQFCAFMRK